MSTTYRMDHLDAEELAREALGLGDDADDNALDEALAKLCIDLEQFHTVAELLLPLATLGKSPLTGTVYRGFAKDGAFIVKQEVTA